MPPPIRYRDVKCSLCGEMGQVWQEGVMPASTRGIYFVERGGRYSPFCSECKIALSLVSVDQ